MAGQPKARALAEMIEFMGGDAFVFEVMLEQGTLAGAARALDTTRILLSSWSRANPQREAAFNDIRKVYGDELLYSLIDLADETPDINPLTGSIDAGWVSNQKNRIDTRKWVAARYNAQLADRQPQTQVTVDVGQVLQELMSTIKQTPQRLVQPQGATIDGMVVRQTLSQPLVSAGDDE